MKFLACDMDGTLLDDNKVVDGNKEAIVRLRRAGHKFIIATGRDLRGFSVTEDKEKIEFDYLVLCNGAIIYDRDLNIIEKRVLDFNKIHEITKKYYNVNNIGVCVGYNNKWSLIDSDDKSDIGWLKGYISGIEPLDLVFAKETEIPLVSVFARNLDTDAVTHIVEELQEQYGDIFEITQNKFSIDITAKNSNKGDGVLKVLELEGGNVSDLYSIGDSFNDLSMFRITKNSYTFNDADDVIKDEANNYVDYVHECIDDMLK